MFWIAPFLYSKGARFERGVSRGAQRVEGFVLLHSGMIRMMRIGRCGDMSQALLACMLLCQCSQRIEGKTSIGNPSPASAPIPQPQTRCLFLRGGGGGGWDVGALKRNADVLIQKMASFDRSIGENHCNTHLPISPRNTPCSAEPGSLSLAVGTHVSTYVCIRLAFLRALIKSFLAVCAGPMCLKVGSGWMLGEPHTP